MLCTYEIFGYPNHPYIYPALMYRLRASGYVPMNTADILRARLESLKSNDPKQIEFWLDNYFNTLDGVAYCDGKVKIVPNAQVLIDIEPGAVLSRGALVLTPEQYRVLEGQEFSRSDLVKAGLSPPNFSKEKVKSHPVLQALIRDPHLLSEYADAIFAEIRQRYDENEAMGILLLDYGQEIPTMRDWCVMNLNVRSEFLGIGNLSTVPNLVCLRAATAGEVQRNLAEKTETTIKPMKTIKTYSTEDVEKARWQLEKLRELVRPEHISSLDELLRKLLSL